VFHFEELRVQVGVEAHSAKVGAVLLKSDLLLEEEGIAPLIRDQLIVELVIVLADDSVVDRREDFLHVLSLPLISVCKTHRIVENKDPIVRHDV